MLRIISLILLSHSFGTARPECITFLAEKSTLGGHIGHTYVFSEKKQILRFKIPQNKIITAQLYRVAGSTLIRTASPITLTPQNDHSGSIQIDFPNSTKATQYTLIFHTKEKSRLHITALSNQHLQTLQRYTSQKPIDLINSPEGLTNTFRQLNISSRIQNPPTSKGEMCIFFRKKNHQYPNTQAKRLIIVAPPDEPNSSEQEIWIQQKKGNWKIIVPFYYFTQKSLLSAHGQFRLKNLLLHTPDSL